jgi:hypothetical protein
MPNNPVLRSAAELVQDIATFCVQIKPSLFVIAEFVLFVIGLVTVVMWIARTH